MFRLAPKGDGYLFASRELREVIEGARAEAATRSRQSGTQPAAQYRERFFLEEYEALITYRANVFG
jgi:hypothetical protein